VKSSAGLPGVKVGIVGFSRSQARLHTRPVPRGPRSHLWQPATSTCTESNGSSTAARPCTPSSTISVSSPTAAAISRIGSRTPVPECTQVSASRPAPRGTALTIESTDAWAGSS
jgi:hypothetical protein